MALYLDSETHKGFKMFVAWSDNFSKDTKDILLIYPLGPSTHLEPDILECEVKWALASLRTKLLEVMEFQ